MSASLLLLSPLWSKPIDWCCRPAASCLLPVPVVQRLGVNNITIINPGAGQCNGTFTEGIYNLTQTAPLGATFDHWECWNTSTGSAIGPLNGSTVSLTRNTSFTCVAVYNVLAPPRLALLSSFPAAVNYTGPTANLTATGPNNSSCIVAPSQRLGGNITISSPGAGSCSGLLEKGAYSLSQVAASGTVFSWWECYNITTSNITLTANATSITNLQLVAGQSFTCVAVYAIATVPVTVPKLALLSDYPATYTGPTTNLTAVGPSSSCSQAPSLRLGSNGTTITLPGSGSCFGAGPAVPGLYVLSQSGPPANLVFDRWECYSITNGSAGPPFAPVVSVTNTTNNTTSTFTGLSLSNQTITCVAVYTYVSVSLALISDYPASYTGPTGNLASIGPNNATCVQAPSQRLGVGNVTVANPGLGTCGAGSTAGAGMYVLSQTTPSGTVFSQWECYLIAANGTAVGPVNSTGSSTSNSTSVVLAVNDTMTCVAHYDLALPPAGAQLALLTSVVGGYSGPGGNLTAAGVSEVCIKAPSDVVGVNNVSITAPGSGQCGGLSGSAGLANGAYNLYQAPPSAAITFSAWQCYDITNATAVLVSLNGSSISLLPNTSTTCLAVYTAMPVTGPRLALISSFNPAGNYAGGNLTAVGVGDTCVKAPSEVAGVNGVSITAPGSGWCGGSVLGGTYNLSQTAPPTAPAGTVFARWLCYNVTGTPALLSQAESSISLPAGANISITCVAVYSVPASRSPRYARNSICGCKWCGWVCLATGGPSRLGYRMDTCQALFVVSHPEMLAGPPAMHHTPRLHVYTRVLITATSVRHSVAGNNTAL